MVLFRVLTRETTFVLAENEAEAAGQLRAGSKIIRVMPVKNMPKEADAVVLNKENVPMKVSDCKDALGLRNPRGS